MLLGFTVVAVTAVWVFLVCGDVGSRTGDLRSGNLNGRRRFHSI